LQHEIAHPWRLIYPKEFDDRDVVEVVLIPGLSHGFLQFVGVFPEGWKYIHRCGRWIEQIFAETEQKELQAGLMTPGTYRHHRRTRTKSSGDEDAGLEMTLISKKGKRSEERGRDERRQKRSY
jgi:hypothetical protein